MGSIGIIFPENSPRLACKGAKGFEKAMRMLYKTDLPIKLIL